MQLHTIPQSNNFKTSRRVGRGGKRGKTSGRGGKGQTARAGNKPRPEWRDIIKKFPKRRGYGRNRSRTVVPQVSAIAVDLDMISAHFKDGDVVSGKTLAAKGIIRKVSGRVPQVKIVGDGTLAKKLSFENVSLSASAKEKMEKAGGSMTLRKPKSK
ncbi:hypothetical protein A2841_00520 [Candidatus Kaiserbacteria bacterium RIFCSPHIGHO2_01_FULL_48_10]|uniref:Large ribosomal subunit protein uL15 n=1 Tax=Candidatus Kaiserbacteria bacterium RIFCSPHIGHO2_01_FULL_48_10 TaxID=1798476 RepID=A0A1F6C5K8_9BACT|nr:MAG: hypothetical protein A2841_00520 [Candidatus Kaiserbacteria bacterium RIFCSPHIGHO2_01_FULL_48_10]